MSASRLYNGLEKWLSQSYGMWQDQRHLEVLIHLVMGLLYSGSVNLTKWSTYLPNRGRQAQSQQRRISRWLKNPRIDADRLYGRLINSALAQWQQPVVYVSLDSSMLWNQYCLIRLIVVHRGRGLVLSWRVIEHASSSVTYSDYERLLHQAKDRLPRQCQVVLLADRGFVQTELMQALEQLGWGYRIRLKASNWCWRRGYGWSRLSSFHLSAGEVLLMHTVRLHKTQFFGPVHLAIARHPNGQFWAVVSNQKTTLKTLEEYGFRFCIEETFLDDKSNGFELERSALRDAKMLERLCLVLAVATLYLTAQGIEVVESGQRQRVDVHWFRGNSFLRIGWDWLRRALITPLKLIDRVYFSGNFSLDPVIISLRQLEALPDNLFQPNTFSYLDAD